MSTQSTKPTPEGVTSKPKVTVATIKPNIHRINADQENDEQDRPADDAILKKRRPSPAMLKRSLTKVKEIDSDDHHLDVPDADQEDPKRENVDSEKREDADQEVPKREKVESKDIEDADLEDSNGEDSDLKELEDADEQDLRRSKVESKKTEDADEDQSEGPKVESTKTEEDDGEVVPYESHGEILHRGKKKPPLVKLSEQESEDHHGHRHHRGGWAIRKDDEFFHFIVACFAIGAVLVFEHSYGDWTVSAGIGLLVFASLETIGIYFGFVTRIRAVLEGFLPLFQRPALPGFSKEK